VDFLAVDFFAVDFFGAARLAVDFFGAARLAVDFLAVDFLAVDFLAVVLFAVDFLAAGIVHPLPCRLVSVRSAPSWCSGTRSNERTLRPGRFATWTPVWVMTPCA
jgi:hypothetical protein